jgi:hypothetical protein
MSDVRKTRPRRQPGCTDQPSQNGHNGHAASSALTCPKTAPAPVAQGDFDDAYDRTNGVAIVAPRADSTEPVSLRMRFKLRTRERYESCDVGLPPENENNGTPDTSVDEEPLLTDIKSVDDSSTAHCDHQPKMAKSDPVGDILGHPFYAEVGESKPVIVIFPWMLQFKERNELLIVGWLWYWLRPGKDGAIRAQEKRNGHVWAVTTYLRLARAIGLNKGQVQHALKQLVTQGVVICEHGWVNKYHIGKGTFLRFNLDILYELVTAPAAAAATSVEEEGEADDELL